LPGKGDWREGERGRVSGAENGGYRVSFE